jgi:hypothetical protein
MRYLILGLVFILAGCCCKNYKIIPIKDYDIYTGKESAEVIQRAK